MKNTIRILFCDDAHTFGGAQKALSRLVNYFAMNKNFSVFCAISYDNNSFYKEFSKIENVTLLNGYQVSKYSILTSYFSRNKKRARAIIEDVNPDYTFLNLSGIEFCINYKQILDEKKLPHSSWIHNTSYFSTMLITKKLQSKLRDLLADRFLINLHKNLIVVSESSKSDMINRGQKECFLNVIENSIPKINLMQNEHNMIIKNTRYKIGIFGRVQYIHKGQNELIPLLKKYQNNLLDVEFHIVGDGEDLDDLKNSINNSHPQSVVFHGWVDNISSIMKECDLIWMPSRFEGLSLVFLEALALEKEILSTDIPAFYLVHENDKYIVNDIDSLYHKIIDKKNMTPTSPYNYKDIVEKLSSDKWFGKFENIVKKNV